MKTRIIKTDLEKYVVFTDIKNQNSLYAATKDEFERMEKIVSKYGYYHINVPDGNNIRACRLAKVRDVDAYSEEYDVNENAQIDFPINRYHWVIIWYR